MQEFPQGLDLGPQFFFLFTPLFSFPFTWHSLFSAMQVFPQALDLGPQLFFFAFAKRETEANAKNTNVTNASFFIFKILHNSIKQI